MFCSLDRISTARVPHTTVRVPRKGDTARIRARIFKSRQNYLPSCWIFTAHLDRLYHFFFFRISSTNLAFPFSYPLPRRSSDPCKFAGTSPPVRTFILSRDDCSFFLPRRFAPRIVLTNAVKRSRQIQVSLPRFSPLTQTSAVFKVNH